MTDDDEYLDDYDAPDDDEVDLPGGIRRRTFDDAVHFTPIDLVHKPTVECWGYAVARYPFVPGFHVVFMEGPDVGTDDVPEYILSTHKTLHEAMGLCRLLLANGGITYYD